jgi:hypothetical protein
MAGVLITSSQFATQWLFTNPTIVATWVVFPSQFPAVWVFTDPTITGGGAAAGYRDLIDLIIGIRITIP